MKLIDVLNVVRVDKLLLAIVRGIFGKKGGADGDAEASDRKGK